MIPHTRFFLASIAAALLGGCTLQPPAPPTSTPAAWTQLGPDNRLSIRAIVPNGQSCPTAEIDGRAMVLQPRAAAGTALQPAFDVLSCELSPTSPPGRIEIAGQPLPVPRQSYGRIAVVGDTGCRIKVAANGQGDPIQDCVDRQAWPWAVIAAAIAAKQPELVVHVGDYHYREYCDDPERCTPLKQGGLVVDYGWQGWRADFFVPAAPLLRTAPWVFVRGNHENCDRAGEGWQRFLAPGPYRPCPRQVYKSTSRSVPGNNLTETGYRVDIDTEISLFVADSAGNEDYRPAADATADAAVLQAALSGLRQLPAGRRIWRVSHKPLWYDLLAAMSQPNAWQAAARRTLTGRVDLTVAGHEHAFQTLNFAADADPGYAGGRPAQLIVGGGGTQLESLDPNSPLYEGKNGPGSRERAQPDGRLYEGHPAASGIVLNRFSFLLLEKDEAGWRGTVFDRDGQAITRCRLPGGAKQFDCAFPE